MKPVFSWGIHTASKLVGRALDLDMVANMSTVHPESRKPEVRTLYMPHPERFWLAARTDLPLLSDPDGEDHRGEPRWSDRDAQNWRRIAETVAEAGRRIAGGCAVRDADGDLVLAIHVAGLSQTEEKIVTSWLAGGMIPTTDPWSDHFIDGRHRLWNSWRASPEALLPIYSDTLGYIGEAPYHGPEFRAFIVEEAQTGLETSSEVAARSPLYLEALRRAARGDF